MFKSLGDRLVARSEATVDDEFERAVLHRSSSIASQVAIVTALVVMAVLAWVLPGWHSLWSMLLLAPAVIGEIVSQSWMRAQVASPRAAGVGVAGKIFLVVLIIVWAAGLQFRIGGVTGDFASGFGDGALVGGLIGLAFGLMFLPRLFNRTRAKDAERLAATEED